MNIKLYIGLLCSFVLLATSCEKEPITTFDSQKVTPPSITTKSGVEFPEYILKKADEEKILETYYLTKVVNNNGFSLTCSYTLEIDSATRNFSQVKSIALFEGDSIDVKIKTINQLIRKNLFGGGIIKPGTSGTMEIRVKAETGTGSGKYTFYSLPDSFKITPY